MDIKVTLKEDTVADTGPRFVRIGNGDIEMPKQLDHPN